MVQVNDDERTAKVVVMDDMLSLAIGKDGQNARLAAKLTGWKIDVKPYSSLMQTPEEEAEDSPEENEAANQEEESSALNEEIFDEDLGDLE